MTDSVAGTLELDATTPLSEQLVGAVAKHEGVDPVALETPLYEAIDPDALDRLFVPTGSGDRADGRVEFEYCGYRIVVSFGDDPEIRLEELEPAAGAGSGEPSDRTSAADVHFCLDCGWRVSSRDGYSPQQRSRKAIDHYVRTGHAIDSSRSADEPTGGGFE